MKKIIVAMAIFTSFVSGLAVIAFAFLAGAAPAVAQQDVDRCKEQISALMKAREIRDHEMMIIAFTKTAECFSEQDGLCGIVGSTITKKMQNEQDLGDELMDMFGNCVYDSIKGGTP